jgi:hypothetical protein
LKITSAAIAKIKTAAKLNLKIVITGNIGKTKGIPVDVRRGR